MSHEIRVYRDSDEPEVLELLSSSLGWVPDGQHARFFRWKHLENPAGRSAMWVATVGDRVVGFRAMLRWRFLIDGEPVHAVRAVDTATAPSARGSGVFRDLTMHAIDQLRDEGIGFVFNTPNDQSRPGYLKMGWVELGRPRAVARPTGIRGVSRMVRSRVPADLWSLSSGAGVAAEEVLAGDLAGVLPSHDDGGVVTDRTPEHLRWRYAGMPELGYRAIVADEGLALFRLRRRGAATEAAVCELLGRGGPAARRQLVRQVGRASGADYALLVGAGGSRRLGLPLPNAGPIVTWRALRREASPPLERWGFSLGDVELL